MFKFPVLQAPKGSNLEKTRVKYDLTIQPTLPPTHEHFKKELSNRRLEKMQFPTRDDQFKKRLLAGGARNISQQTNGDNKSAGKERDRSKNNDSRKGKDDERKRKEEKSEKPKDSTDRERDRKNREREKSLDKEKHKSYPKPSTTGEEKQKVKPKPEFTELFGTPIKKDSRKEEMKGNSKHREGSGSKRSPSKDNKETKSSSSSKHKDHERHKHRSSNSRQPSSSRKHSRSPSRDKERNREKERKKDEKRDESKRRDKDKEEERKRRDREKAELKKEEEKAERMKKEEQEKKLQAEKEKRKLEEQRKAEEKREEAERKRKEDEKAEAERIKKEQLRQEKEMMDQLEGEGILLANSKKEKRRERKNEKRREEKSRKSLEKLPEKPSKFKSRETIPSCDSDSDFDMEASNPKISKKVTTPSGTSEEEEAPKTKEVKANASIVGAIFKQKKSRESSNPPSGDKKEDRSKAKSKAKDQKESPVKKKKKTSRERSLSFSSSDSWSSPTSARKKGSAEKPVLKQERPISSTSGDIPQSQVSRISSSPGVRKTAAKRSYSSSSSSPGRSPGVPVIIPTPMSPMSADESGGAEKNSQHSGRSRKEKDTSSKKPKIKEEKMEIKKEKTVSPVPLSRHPDEVTPQRSRPSLYPDTVKVKERTDSEEDVSSEQGVLGVEPYCQPSHLPHPSLEELSDKKYIARLQVSLHLSYS